MKKTITSFFIAFICLFGFMEAQTTIYVATNGDDSNDGTVDNPYKTLSKAVSEMSAGTTCIIREGVYREVLDVSASGTSSNPITIKAADGEKVEIRATNTVSGWQLHNGNIYKATVNMGVASRFRAVYHNDEYMDLARWPNNADNNRWTVNCHPVDGGGSGNHITATGIPDYDWENGGLLYYLGAHSGTSWTRPITASTTTRIDHTQVDISKWPFGTHNPETWRNYPGNNRGQFFLFNKLEALDFAREWYYDNASNTLYFQPANGTMPADDEVEFAREKFAAELSGDYIVIDGIEFFGGSLKINNNADNNTILNCKVIHGNEGHDSLTNTSAQVGEAAIEVLGDNTLIKGCTVDHSAVSGILIAGWAADDCTIEGNYISNTDYVGIHSSPIRSSGDNIKVVKNTIVNTGRDGMYVAGSNCEIAYNDVSASQIINSDSGVFYTVGNTNLKNNEIHHNWFHDATAPAYSHNPNDPAKAAGIYLDNDSKGYIVHHNVVWNVSWSGYQVNWNNTDLDFFHNTIWNAERAMDSWDINGPQENNKIYNNYANTGSWFTGTGPASFDIQNSPIFPDSPFVDAANLNFMPNAGSALVDEGMVISGFDKPFQGGAPDLGAYERGGTAWTAGVGAIEDTGEGETLSIYDTRFTIQTFTESCPGMDNGKLEIDADLIGDYVVTFNGVDTNFTDDISLENIAPGTYDICISFNGETESQCSTVIIGEAAQVFGKSVLSSNKITMSISEGTAPYTVYVNDEIVLSTFESSFSVVVKQDDVVKVKSSKDCEGDIVESIDFFGNIMAYPSPTYGSFQLVLPMDEGRIHVALFDIHSRLISEGLYPIESGRVTLNLDGQPSGIYFARLVNQNTVNVKVVKL